ncbi:ER lumen protein retaining receptor-like [Hibiscus syriacus]|uniref:ER lumen protein retaining receptor-like n=1 Tax=Hibiscus syriacus TaxID=106335 RepID=A0A6A2WZW0_HIBSY|nr:ER lumen protein retaining receptor-like [Hibiscus syriacus]
MVFASVSSIKAAYVELQMAQNPYNSDAIQAADQAVIEQLKVLSELNFVMLMVKEMEMEIAKWDVDVAVKSIEPVTILAKQIHRCFVFELFVCKTMLEGFVSHDFGVTKEEYFNEFKSLKNAQPKSFPVQNPYFSFVKFSIAKYLKLVHPRMKCSFFGNLNQRKLVINGEFPYTPFFTAYAEMGIRFWLFRCLGFSMSEQVSVSSEEELWISLSLSQTLFETDSLIEE